MDLASLLHLISQHGQVVYSVVFTYAAQHGLLMALLAGYAAQAGALDLVTVFLVTWVGSFTGDVFRFWIGRRFGAAWLRRFPRLQGGMRKTSRLVERHYLWLPMVHRYPNGIRTFAAVAYGMSNLSWPLFLALNVAAAGLWAMATTAAGYAFGRLSEKMMSDVASHLSLVLLVVFLAVAWLLSRRLERTLERS
jgi:membrane protein DedA with SNARE-associated domain